VPISEEELEEDEEEEINYTVLEIGSLHDLVT